MTKRHQQLLSKRVTTRAQMDALLTAAEATDGIFAADAATQYAALEATLTGIDDGIAREKRLVESDRNAPAVASTQITDVHNREADAPFLSLGEQLVAIQRAASGEVDPRLFGAASGGQAGVGSDAGFLIQKDFATDLASKAQSSGELASRCSSQEIGANSDGLEVAYLDETSRATGSRWGGVRVYRRAEAETVTSSKPKIGKWKLDLDMMGIAYLTNRAVQDASQIQAVYESGFLDEAAFVLDDEIFRGNGVGQCQGIVAAPCTVSVAKEAGQDNDTVVAENVMKMWSRVHPRSRARGAWFINLEVEPQLQQMQIGTGASGQLVYMPAGGLSASPYGQIYGRPVIPIEHASALGDLGDITFLDLTEYQLIRKGGTQKDVSMHVRFLYDESAFRWIWRVNGAPKWKAPLTPYKGSSTLSPFVTLAAR